jgi:hypothetical protein
LDCRLDLQSPGGGAVWPEVTGKNGQALAPGGMKILSIYLYMANRSC